MVVIGVIFGHSPLLAGTFPSLPPGQAGLADRDGHWFGLIARSPGQIKCHRGPSGLPAFHHVATRGGGNAPTSRGTGPTGATWWGKRKIGRVACRGNLGPRPCTWWFLPIPVAGLWHPNGACTQEAPVRSHSQSRGRCTPPRQGVVGLAPVRQRDPVRATSASYCNSQRSTGLGGPEAQECRRISEAWLHECHHRLLQVSSIANGSMPIWSMLWRQTGRVRVSEYRRQWSSVCRVTFPPMPVRPHFLAVVDSRSPSGRRESLNDVSRFYLHRWPILPRLALRLVCQALRHARYWMPDVTTEYAIRHLASLIDYTDDWRLALSPQFGSGDWSFH